MGLINAIRRLVRAKSDEAAEKIEDGNRIAFAQQDIEEMKEELIKARQNFAKMSATLMQIDRDIASRMAELTSRSAQAKALKDKGNLDLARSVAEKCMTLKDEVAALEGQKVMIEKSKEQQEQNVQELSEAVDTASRDLQFMTVQEKVTESTRALSSVDKDGVASTLQRFKDRKQKQQANLDEALAAVESERSMNLDSRVEEALGTKSQAADDFLNNL